MTDKKAVTTPNILSVYSNGKEATMLIISRRVNESFIIDNKTTITIIKSGETVKIGIDAPLDVNVRREELFEVNRDFTHACKRKKMK